MSKYDLKHDYVLTRLSYDPLSGELTWLTKGNSRKIVPGSRAGSVSPHGHRVVRLDGFLYPEHVLIWFIHTGCWPKFTIDHNDHDEQNNRWNNLSDVPHAVNNRNQSKRSDNASGHSGVWINKQNPKKKYMSEVKYEGKRVHLKSHYSLQEAIDTVEAVRKLYGFHPNHGIDKPV